MDEANYINNAILNDLNPLFNFDMDSRDQAVVLLAGLPKLNDTLSLAVHEPLRQRIVMNYNLEGMLYSKLGDWDRTFRIHRPVLESGADPADIP